ncbi:hypothetical protein MALG_02554 [Marinovum algicola DG 898]|nr:hypothetical protein MALG_02554 [Marinovum algicola DG 898]
MSLDIPHRQPGGIEPDDLVIYPVDPGLALLHQFGLEAAVAVAGHRHRHLSVLPLQHLGRGAVPAVALTRWNLLALLIAQMRGQLGAQHPLHQLDLQFFHQPGITEQVFRAFHALQQFIQDFFRDGHSCFLSVKHEPDQSYTEDLTLSRNLAHERRRFRYRRLFVLLRRDGETSGINRIYRLYREEGLAVRQRRARRKAIGTRAPILVEARPNARWSLDFDHDHLACGRRFRILNVVDDVTRECLAAIPDTSLSGQRVARELGRLIERRGKPGMSVSDNSTERTCRSAPRAVRCCAIFSENSTSAQASSSRPT